MPESSSKIPAAGLIRHAGMRGFLAALFTAGVSLMILAVLQVVEGPKLAYVFIVVLVAGVFGSQLQERMRRQMR